jgi:ABC-2 type transport system permease protein
MQSVVAQPQAAAPYLAVLSSRFRMLLQYRAVALAGIATQVIWGIIRAQIFAAFYASSTAPQPMTADQTITYLWLGQAFLLIVMFSPDAEIASMINSGHVAYEMTRPLDLYWLWFFRCLAGRAAPLLLRFLPIMLIAWIFFSMSAPASLTAAILFLVSITLGLILAAALVTLVTLSMLWTISGQGIAAMAPAFVFIASGIVVPLPLLPMAARRFLDLLPFRGLIDTPLRIYVGEMSASHAAGGILSQLLWIIVVIVVGKLALRRGLSRLVVQGG